MNKLKYKIISLLLSRDEKELIEEAIESGINYVSYRKTHECDIYSSGDAQEDIDKLNDITKVICNTEKDFFLKSFNPFRFINNSKPKFLR